MFQVLSIGRFGHSGAVPARGVSRAAMASARRGLNVWYGEDAKCASNRRRHVRVAAAAQSVLLRSHSTIQQNGSKYAIGMTSVSLRWCLN
jgi:hypothetical protein